MPRRKRPRTKADLDKSNGSPPYDRVLRKRPSAGPPHKEDAVELEIICRSDEARKPRETPCVGCLVGLVNWMPEDGEPKLCYDTTRKSSPPLLPSTLRLGDVRLTSRQAPDPRKKCVRCKHHDKECRDWGALVGAGNVRVLALLHQLTLSPRNMDEVRAAQGRVRVGLECELWIEACDYAVFDDGDVNPLIDSVSANIVELTSTIDLLQALVDGIGARRTWRQVREIRDATERASALVHEIGNGSPPQSAGLAAERLGIF